MLREEMEWHLSNEESVEFCHVISNYLPGKERKVFEAFYLGEEYGEDKTSQFYHTAKHARGIVATVCRIFRRPSALLRLLKLFGYDTIKYEKDGTGAWRAEISGRV